MLVDAGQVLSDSNGILVYLCSATPPAVPGCRKTPGAGAAALVQPGGRLFWRRALPGPGLPLTGRAVNEVAQATGKRLPPSWRRSAGAAWVARGSAPSLADVAMVSYTSQAAPGGGCAGCLPAHCRPGWRVCRRCWLSLLG